MDTSAEFHRFVDLLLASVPSLAAEVTGCAHGQLQAASLAPAAAGDRQHTMILLQATRPGDGRGLAAALSAALRKQLREELTSLPSDEVRDVPVTGPSIDSLTLVDDRQIEEDIEVARVIQLVDTAAEGDLRDLRALCATLRGAPAAAPELHPMRPEVCARALVRALYQLQWPREARLLALRVVGECLADRLATLYREQLRELRRWGVEPVPYRLQIAPEVQSQRPRDDAAMQRLARRVVVGADNAAAQLIPALLAQVADQAGLDSSLRALLARLAQPAIRSAGADAGVLSSVEHPVWQLVDRLAAVASVQSRQGAASVRLAARLEPVIARLEQSAGASPASFKQALADVEDAASNWADAQLSDAGVFAQPERVEAGGSLPTDWGGVGSLPTVPMPLNALHVAEQHKVWWAAMSEGQRLRIFLLARWTTVLVIGCTRTHVLFSTPERRKLQTMSRRALLQLREQGLATTIETLQPVRQAVDTLTLDLDAPD
jgi:hypothetical protein